MSHNAMRILVVAGEPSGDAHGAKLVRELRLATTRREIEFFGSAGPALRSEGVEPVVDADKMAIIGPLEIARRFPMYLRAFRRLREEARIRRPDVAVLVDFPEFNLRLARALKRKGIRVVYYVSPQVWAWRKGRISYIRRYVDLLLSILPFEKNWYAERGVANVEFVGNPLVEEVAPSVPASEFRKLHGLDPKAKLIALLPGSRKTEIRHILPHMVQSASRLGQADPSLQFVVPVAPSRSVAELETEAGFPLAGIRTLSDVAVTCEGCTYDALAASDAAAVTSGTATLEAALLGTPLVAVYKTSAVNYSLLRPFVDIEFFSLVNLVAGRPIVTELLQGELSAERLSGELTRLLDPEVNRRLRSEFAEIRESLSHHRRSKSAAELVLDIAGAG